MIILFILLFIYFNHLLNKSIISFKASCNSDNGPIYIQVCIRSNTILYTLSSFHHRLMQVSIFHLKGNVLLYMINIIHCFHRTDHRLQKQPHRYPIRFCNISSYILNNDQDDSLLRSNLKYGLVWLYGTLLSLHNNHNGISGSILYQKGNIVYKMDLFRHIYLF